jgi:hypothetical protein
LRLDPSLETLQKATEDYFGNVLNLSSFQASLDHTASEIEEDIFQFVLPLISIVSDDTDLIKNDTRNNCFRIAQSACQLNAEIKSKSRCPVEIYCPLSGDIIDRLYVQGTEAADNMTEIMAKMMLMFGIRSARESERPLPYAKARAISAVVAAGQDSL